MAGYGRVARGVARRGSRATARMGAPLPGVGRIGGGSGIRPPMPRVTANRSVRPGGSGVRFSSPARGVAGSRPRRSAYVAPPGGPKGRNIPYRVGSRPKRTVAPPNKSRPALGRKGREAADWVVNQAKTHPFRTAGIGLGVGGLMAARNRTGSAVSNTGYSEAQGIYGY